MHSIAAKTVQAIDSLLFAACAVGYKRSRYVEQAVLSPVSISAMACQVWYLVKLKKGTRYGKFFKLFYIIFIIGNRVFKDFQKFRDLLTFVFDMLLSAFQREYSIA